ncbi:MAG TPA: LCCL domain-containing protein [Candidatus Saccharimonadales bacterium]|nr:LCCL domain-containing protein [Candidatus Saccharimonadales bacterium]
MLRPKKLTDAGDTIVEVMVVLAILGLAIGISYATANRSLLNARQAQESSQATEQVQSQVEALRTMVSNPNVYSTPSFCLTPSGTTYSIQPSASSCNFGEASRYNITISHLDANTFRVRATWNDVLGEGTDSATIIYRMYPPTAPVVGGGGGGGGGGGLATSGCPANATSYADRTVTGGVTLNQYGDSRTWGSGPYTDDSALGTAAIHAGLISSGQTATIRVCSQPGQSSYTGSTRNGITTLSYGSWPGSITLILPSD